MNSILGVKWGTFVLNDIFEIRSTSSSIDRKKLNGLKGRTPYITRTDSNNGWDSLISDQTNYKKDHGNVITVGLDTQTVFYQPIPFYTGQNIQIFTSKHINKYVASFIIPLLKKQMEKFNWGGNGATLGRLRCQRIMLPITDKNEPDYAFMEDYMKTVEMKLISLYKAHIESNGYKSSIKIPNYPIQWKAFSLNEICNIYPGVRLVSRDMNPGKRPFIGATDSNNGHTNYVSNTNASLDSNVLGVNYNGNGVAIGFYHPYEAIFTDDVKRLKFKEHEGNKYVYLFLKSAILKQKSKFQYGYKFNGERMNRQKIMLPATVDMRPDFDYMEQYMRNKESELLYQYINKKLEHSSS